MLSINLPAPQTPPLTDFTVGADLDGQSYTLRFMWNARDGYWYVRVLDEPGQNVLMADTRVVADWFLYRSRIRSQRTPPGLPLAQDTSGQGKAPGVSDLGVRVLLSYVEAADLDAAGFRG